MPLTAGVGAVPGQRGKLVGQSRLPGVRVRRSRDQYSSRNRDEVRLAKQDMSAEDQGLLYAKKQRRLAWLEQWLADVEERLQSPDMSDTARKGFINAGLKLVHEIAEQRGELPVRGALWDRRRAAPFPDDGSGRIVQSRGVYDESAPAIGRGRFRIAIHQADRTQAAI